MKSKLSIPLTFWIWSSSSHWVWYCTFEPEIDLVTTLERGCAQNHHDTLFIVSYSIGLDGLWFIPFFMVQLRIRNSVSNITISMSWLICFLENFGQLFIVAWWSDFNLKYLILNLLHWSLIVGIRILLNDLAYWSLLIVWDMLLRIEEIGDDANFTKKQFNKYSQHYIVLQMKNITLVNNEIIFFKSFLTTFIYLVIAVSLAVLRQNYTNTLFVKGSKYQ